MLGVKVFLNAGSQDFSLILNAWSQDFSLMLGVKIFIDGAGFQGQPVRTL
jgi:hypothetical protein